MKMRDFLKVNSLKQVELARYLSVTEAAISNVVKGKSEFSEENLIKIINNPFGWDVSMLVESKPENPVQSQPEDVRTLDRLFALIDDQRAEIKMLLGMLKDKDVRIDELRKELEHKGGIVPDAGSSSVANAG